MTLRVQSASSAHAETATPVQLRLVDGFEFRRGSDWSAGTRPLELELAYLLALHRDPVDAHQLAEWLWPGLTWRWTAARLAEVRSRLRRRAGAILARSPDGWALDERRVQCDLWLMLDGLEEAVALADAGPAKARLRLGGLLAQAPHTLHGRLAEPQTDQVRPVYERRRQQLDTLRAHARDLL